MCVRAHLCKTNEPKTQIHVVCLLNGTVHFFRPFTHQYYARQTANAWQLIQLPQLFFTDFTPCHCYLSKPWRQLKFQCFADFFRASYAIRIFVWEKKASQNLAIKNVVVKNFFVVVFNKWRVSLQSVLLAQCLGVTRSWDLQKILLIQNCAKQNSPT